MYEAYWNLKEKPFENTPNPKFLYYSSQHEEALSRLLYVVKENKGAGLLTGVFGCGKTLLGRALLKELEKDLYKVAFITNPRMDAIDLLRIIAHHLGASDIPTSKSDILITLEKILNNNYRDGKKTLIVIDETHTIEDKNVFEEIRMLLNFQLDDKFLITLLMFGQPELRNKIEENKQLLQRVAMKYHLEGLLKEETSSYINHRLKVSGGNASIFGNDALELIYERSSGIPRRVNQICDMSLVIGFGKKAKQLDKTVIQEAIDSLEG